MYEFFRHPAARFAAGAVAACFLLMPFMWVVLGPPSSPWFLAPFLVAGVAGGVWWMRSPPAIMYKPHQDTAVHATGAFAKPAARFLAGFISASLVFISVTWLIGASLEPWSFISSMVAVGIFCGLMAARRSASAFSRHRPT